MVNRNGNLLTGQFMEVVAHEQGDSNPTVYHPYAIWHNQKTGKFTLRTEVGFHSIAEADILEIKLLQTKLPFED